MTMVTFEFSPESRRCGHPCAVDRARSGFGPHRPASRELIDAFITVLMDGLRPSPATPIGDAS
ncbi:hypothetical protein Airi01_087880 [Actinoallomurus iriomotensis]|uniref:Uncharacterized protein n=1 Tax=Actinoallomurus iriomotensis TaxID=478107 RepID=A0A9W6RRB9_9ACTN|nr:hypothetical protein Airi01_087880 [Actinoallomurus iriomotensis]